MRISIREEMCNEAVWKGLSELGYKLVHRGDGWATFEGIFQTFRKKAPTNIVESETIVLGKTGKLLIVGPVPSVYELKKR